MLLEAVALVGLTVVEGVVFGRVLHATVNYDEEVYLASVDALRHHQVLGSEVFASQPPGFYGLLVLGAGVAGESVVGLRAVMLAIALAGCLAAYAIGRMLGGPVAGFLASGLVALPYAAEHKPASITSDFPSLAFGLIALALVLAAARKRRPASDAAAVLAGAALAAAVSIKLLAVTVLVPFVAVVIRARDKRLTLGAIAGAAIVVLAFLAAYGGVLSSLWRDAVAFHLNAESAPVPGAPSSLRARAAEVFDALTGRPGAPTVFFVLLVVGAVATLVAWSRRQLLETVPLWLWAVASAFFLAVQRPLWKHEILALIVPLALAAAIAIASLTYGSWRAGPFVAAVSCIAVLVGLIHAAAQSEAGTDRELERAVLVVRHRTPPGTTVASDVPLIPFLAGRRQPGDLVDTSFTRVAAGALDRARILRSIERDHAVAVVVGRLFEQDPKLLADLHRLFPRTIRSGRFTIYVGRANGAVG